MRPAKRSPGPLTPINLRDTYSDVGEYSVKMLLDKTVADQLEGMDVIMRNADGSAVPLIWKRWGTKLTLSFTLDDRTPDGVTILNVAMLMRNETRLAQSFRIWVVK